MTSTELFNYAGWAIWLGRVFFSGTLTASGRSSTFQSWVFGEQGAVQPLAAVRQRPKPSGRSVMSEGWEDMEGSKPTEEEQEE